MSKMKLDLFFMETTKHLQDGLEQFLQRQLLLQFRSWDWSRLRTGITSFVVESGVDDVSLERNSCGGEGLSFRLSGREQQLQQ